jgi:tetratricopeptide (TPR) repeat protein
MKMMAQEQVRADDPRLRRVYDHFRRNLNDMLSTAKRAGAQSIVCTVSSNLRDCAPFASVKRSNIAPSQEQNWARLVKQGSELDSSSKYAEALESYRQAGQIDNTPADLHFRIGRCLVTHGDAGAARVQFTQARDLDALRFRADTRINEIIREVCAFRVSEDVRLFESETVMTNQCALGIPGAECFWDHVHFNFAGNYLVARGLADQVVALLPEPLRRQAAAHAGTLSQEQCAERLAYTDWDQRLVLQEMIHRFRDAPFTTQLDHEQALAHWVRLGADSDHATRPEALAKAAAIYRGALARREDDWILHHRLGFVLEAQGDLRGAEQEWKRVVAMIPEQADAWFKLGDIATRESKWPDATDAFQHVLQQRSQSFEAMNGLGLVRMGEGKPDEAIACFARALQMEPKFAQAHVNWGLALARQGKTAEGAAHYQEALRHDPESSAAHINLANILAAAGKHSEATDHYRLALRSRPREASLHLSLANALAALGRNGEAKEHYRSAVTLNPSLADAHFNLALLLAKEGDLAGATICFQQAVQLSPADLEAHLNLGVALARQNRFQDAIPQFDAVLRLQPDNAAARRYLDLARARLNP